MSQPKQVMSGLRSIKRDFSSNSIPSSSQDTTTSPQSSKRTFQRTTSGMEQRLRDIQAALDEAASQKSHATIPPVTQPTPQPSQKRPPPSTEQPAAKRRQLPSSWSENIGPQVSVQSRSSATFQKGPKSTSSSSRSSGKPPSSKSTGVFLSDEQTHILKLVEEGQSVFYTGSAGKSDNSRYL